jgi:tetratricopeptide (TPR) repeat protein
MRIAWLQYLLGSYPEAMNHYQTALAKLDHLDAHLGIINCQLALGQWDAALTKTEQLLPSHSDSSTLLGKAAYAAYMKKDYSRAAELYRNIVSLYPWDLDNRAYLVNNLYLSGAVNLAKQQYAILRKYAPLSQTVIDYKGILDTP